MFLYMWPHTPHDTHTKKLFKGCVWGASKQDHFNKEILALISFPKGQLITDIYPLFIWTPSIFRGDFFTFTPLVAKVKNYFISCT
ncbi:hypothetical protein AC625_24520 [Peribacillus loiseleuriae]|uniref:Uncharacterized protein n=1 Tax=Peribacillus loiseleuriae TaxID=1679170 RepID=A0A0K9G995_9BACI|nr:hypothetical protein AC625_24520 [Peribacillus loiseleuriae]